MVECALTDDEEFAVTLVDVGFPSLSEEQKASLVAFKELIKGSNVSCKELTDEALSGRFKLNDAMLLRFLVARQFEVPKSMSLLQKHLEWRNTVVPTGITGAQIQTKLFNSGAYRLMGTTKEGYSVILSQTKLFDPYAQELEEFLPYVVYTLENSIRHMEKHTKNVWIFDLEGWALTTHGTPRGNSFVKEMLTLVQKQYPERLHQALIINAPWLFSTAWSLISGWLDERTRGKVQFLDSPKELEKFIHKDSLPKSYGGLREDYPIHNE
mmetsp:Transcript_11381/g.13038  ORF Transcript_11381/g.13038 Transcript_11381/m.13038 type:complete len:268 (+) Transcript_11381:122-925(+)